jgi:hypothetical protein
MEWINWKTLESDGKMILKLNLNNVNRFEMDKDKVQ